MANTKDKPPGSDPLEPTLEPSVKPLDPDERRKLFDLPAPPTSTVAPPPPMQRREERLELDVGRGPSAVAAPKVVGRITVGGAVSQAATVARLLLAGLLFAAAAWAALLFVYRN